MSERMIDHAIAEGRLEVLHPTVYRLAGSPSSWLQDLLAATYWAGPGSAVSHRAAGALWDLDGVPSGFVEVSTPRKLRSREVRVHRCFCLDPSEIVRRKKIPVTDPTRTLLDLSSVLSLKELEAAMEDGLRRKLTYVPLIQERFARWARKGRTGTTKWRTLLSLRDPLAPPTASQLETLTVQLLRDAGLAKPQRQHIVRDANGRFAGQVDFAYPSLRFGIEVTGFDPHLAREAMDNDQRRGNRLTLAGWRVLYFTWQRIVSDRVAVIAEIREVLSTSAHT